MHDWSVRASGHGLSRRLPGSHARVPWREAMAGSDWLCTRLSVFGEALELTSRRRTWSRSLIRVGVQVGRWNRRGRRQCFFLEACHIREIRLHRSSP